MNKSEIIVELVEIRDGIGAYVKEANVAMLSREEKRQILIDYNQDLKDRITKVIKEIAKENATN